MPFDKPVYQQVADLFANYIDKPNDPNALGSLNDQRFLQEFEKIAPAKTYGYTSNDIGVLQQNPNYRGIRLVLPQSGSSYALSPSGQARENVLGRGGKRIEEQGPVGLPRYDDNPDLGDMPFNYPPDQGGLREEVYGELIRRGYPVLGGTGQMYGFDEGFNPVGFGQRGEATQSPLGYAEQPNTFWKALEGVVRALRGTQTSQANPSLFHEPTVTAGAGVEQGLNTAGDVLADPRNAWMGLGPLAGMARFGKGITNAEIEAGHRAWQLKQMGREGGFNVPTSRMRKELGTPRPNIRQGEIGGGTEQAVRDDYTEGLLSTMNQMATALQDETHQFHGAATKLYKGLTPEGRLQLDKVMKGQAELEGEIAKTKASTSGGAEPPYWFRSR